MKIEREYGALEQGNERGKGPLLRVGSFTGPLDVLYFLVESQKIDLNDIPIALITEQYMDYLAEAGRLDMDLASDFLLMAATLLQIKSRLLLPKTDMGTGDEEDPRGELVLKLLEYRRCKLLARHLETRYEAAQGMRLRLPESAARLGIVVPSQAAIEKICDISRFHQAATAVATRNEQRFNDLSERLTHILRREHVSLIDKIKEIWQMLGRRSKVFFTEVFPYGSSRAERVTGFLALLELLRSRRIEAAQQAPFAAIEISRAERAEGGMEDGFSEWLQDFSPAGQKNEYKE